MEKKKLYHAPEVHAHQLGDIRVMQSSITENTRDVQEVLNDRSELGAKESMGGGWFESDDDNPWQ